MSTTSGRPIVRPTLQTVPESLPADHVTQPAQASVTPVAVANPSPAIGAVAEKSHQSAASSQSTTPAVSLKPRSSSSRVSSCAATSKAASRKTIFKVSVTLFSDSSVNCKNSLISSIYVAGYLLWLWGEWWSYVIHSWMFVSWVSISEGWNLRVRRRK